MTRLSKLLLTLFAGLMIPPAVWLFILFYTDVFTIHELMSIVFSIPMIAYIIFVTAGVIYFFNVQLKYIDEAVTKLQSYGKTVSIIHWEPEGDTISLKEQFTGAHHNDSLKAVYKAELLLE